MANSLSPIRRAATVMAVLALTVAACGGGQPSDGSAPAGSEGGTIQLGFSAWPGWLPWQVAEAKGLFANAGLDVKLVWFEGYLDSLNTFASGELDANSQTLNDTISSVASGSKQTVVLVNDNSTGNDQIIVSEEIKSVADLKGKKVSAEQGTVDHYLLLLGLQKAGLSQADVSFQPLETGAAAAAFASGQFDAVGAFAPFTTQALKRPGSHALFTSKEFPGAIPDLLVVSGDLVEDRPADVQKLVQVWFDTIEWVKANPTEAVKIMANRAGVSEADYMTYDSGTTIFDHPANLIAFNSGTTVKNLDYNADAIAEFLVKVGLIDKVPDLSGLFEDRFVRNVKAASGA